MNRLVKAILAMVAILATVGCEQEMRAAKVAEKVEDVAERGRFTSELYWHQTITATDGSTCDVAYSSRVKPGNRVLCSWKQLEATK